MVSLISRVERVALSEPDRRAVTCGEQRIDYGTLWAQARAFAAFLQASGIAAGDRVALILPNGIEAIVACYGSWLAGAVIVPLNAQARSRDFGPWLRHSEARCVVHEGGHEDAKVAIDAIETPLLRIITGSLDVDGSSVAWQSVVAAKSTHIAAQREPAELAMILYTSGTTGAPKGVMLSHANLAANVDSIITYLDLGKDDSIVSVLPFYYSYGASVLHTHLAVGAYLVIEPNLVFPHLMVETMARERVSGFSGVPSTFLLLLNRVSLADYDLSSLRYVT
ncbi:class I adenylate-forming enzyme family protein, partial [Dokdonella sp.]|uniref:class I adenylate-forming enzyme family protein n=1 Tax=Dokdonella sp. TaxID=2291710 RepID=UPI003C56069C